MKTARFVLFSSYECVPLRVLYGSSIPKSTREAKTVYKEIAGTRLDRMDRMDRRVQELHPLQFTMRF